MELGFDPPLTHDLRRLLLLQSEGVATANLNPLGQLTVYAVQFRDDAEPTPLELDREAFTCPVKAFLDLVEALVIKSVEADSGRGEPRATANQRGHGLAKSMPARHRADDSLADWILTGKGITEVLPGRDRLIGSVTVRFLQSS